MNVDVAGALQWIGGILTLIGFKTFMATGLGSLAGAGVVARIDRRYRIEAEKDKRRDSINRILFGLGQNAKIVNGMFKVQYEKTRKLQTLLQEHQDSIGILDDSLFIPPWRFLRHENISLELGSLDWLLTTDNEVGDFAGSAIVRDIDEALVDYNLLLELNKRRGDLFYKIFADTSYQYGNFLEAFAWLDFFDLEVLKDPKGNDLNSLRTQLQDVINKTKSKSVSKGLWVEYRSCYQQFVLKLYKLSGVNVPEGKSDEMKKELAEIERKFKENADPEKDARQFENMNKEKQELKEKWADELLKTVEERSPIFVNLFDRLTKICKKCGYDNLVPRSQFL